MVMSLVRQRRQVQTTQRAQPVVHRHIHATPTCHRRAVVDRRRGAAHEVAAAVDEHHDRQRVVGRTFGGDDVERQAVLAHRLVFAWREDGVLALLRRAVAESVAVPHARPRLHRLGGAQPQPAHGRTRIRNRSPPVHPVAGEALDRAGLDRCADNVLVHDPTVSNRGPRRAWPAITCRPASLGRYADCWADRGVCAGGGVFTLGGRRRRADVAVVDSAAEHDARRTIDHVTHLDDSRPTARRRCAYRRRHRLGRSGRTGRPRFVSLRDARRRNDRTRRGRRIRHTVGQGQLHDRLEVQRRRAGLPGGSEEPAAATRRRVRRVEGRLDRLRRQAHHGRPGQGRPGTVHRRQRAGAAVWSVACRSATTAAAATKPAWSASTTPGNRRRGSATPGCNLSGASNRRRRCRRSVRCSAAEHGVVRRIRVHDHRAELRNAMGQFMFGAMGNGMRVGQAQ